MDSQSEVLVIRMGGTIDKDYPRSIGGYAFELDPDGEPASARVLRRGRVDGGRVEHATVCVKDSQDVTHEDRQSLLSVCEAAPQQLLLVTHGTDSLLDTARLLQTSAVAASKRIVLTGAMLPEAFKRSDADFALGMAWALLHASAAPGVWLAVDGYCGPLHAFSRNTDTGKFAVNHKHNR